MKTTDYTKTVSIYFILCCRNSLFIRAYAISCKISSLTQQSLNRPLVTLGYGKCCQISAWPIALFDVSPGVFDTTDYNLLLVHPSLKYTSYM